MILVLILGYWLSAAKGDWTRIRTDCPDPSCGLQLNTTYLAVKFTPDLNQPWIRRFIWFFNGSGVDRGRIHFTEEENYVMQVTNDCDEIRSFATTNSTNTERERMIVIRSSSSGVSVVFPDGTSWGACLTWDVTVVGFDKFKRSKLSAMYTTIDPLNTTDYDCDLPGKCLDIPNCTAAGPCIKGEPCSIVPAHVCHTCTSQPTIQCSKASTQCIAANMWCDGRVDCRDGEDEAKCEDHPNCETDLESGLVSCRTYRVDNSCLKLGRRSVLSVITLLMLIRR